VAREPAISLVVPISDELPNLGPLVDRTLAALRGIGEPYELILVDDGSRDGSAEELLRLATLDPAIVVLRHRRRLGKGAALATGIARARGERIATIDADLQEDPAELPRLLAALDGGLDLVGGRRSPRRDSLAKNLSSRLYNRLARLVGGPPLGDINCGFKAMRRDLARALPLEAGRFRLMPLVAHWWGYKVGEVDVSHRPRRAGRSHFGGERFPGALFDLFAVVFLFRYEERPGHPFLYAGVLSGLAGLTVCLRLAWIWFAESTIEYRYPQLAFGVLLLILGGQLLATGILGEWLAWRSRASRAHRLEYERRGEEGSATEAPAPRESAEGRAEATRPR